MPSLKKCSIYITICVWAVVYRNVAEDSARNRLHPGTQSDVYGQRQLLEPFKNAVRDLQRCMGASYQAYLASIRVESTEIDVLKKLPTDRQTDGFLSLYSRYIYKYKYIYIYIYTQQF